MDRTPAETQNAGLRPAIAVGSGHSPSSLPPAERSIARTRLSTADRKRRHQHAYSRRESHRDETGADRTNLPTRRAVFELKSHSRAFSAIHTPAGSISRQQN